jgi:uncharacterized protein YprB with RNaseH-like and TPR domain
MSDLNEKLKQLLANHNLMTGAQWRHRHDEQEQLRQSGAYEISNCVPGEVVEDESGGFYLVRTDFPLDTLQGGTPLGAIFDSAPKHIAFSACDDELSEFDPASAVFIDTETSGLAGGTGTVTFLVGVGYFETLPPESRMVFRLEQCFMRDFDDEEPMLRYLDSVFQRAETVVSFNGKAFDIPLLRTRYLFNRMPFRLDASLHYDLIHAVRRIWKLRLNDCSLQNIEREVLGIRRHGDVPSADIPQIWFDYLRTRDARQLPRVFYHHQNDILSLVALTALIAQSLDVPNGDGFEHAEDRLSVLRLNFRQKKFGEAVEHAKKLLETETEDIVRRHTMEFYALACKKLLDWEQMAEVFSLMSREFPSEITPRLELAKHYEHRAKDLPMALQICTETADALQRNPLADKTQWPLSDLLHRIDRIQRKLGKGQMHQDNHE